MKANFKNLIELVEFFKTEEKCVKYLKSILWKDGAFCPHCGCTEIMEYKDFKRNRCKACKKDFSIKQNTNTIFQDSNIPLKKWFMAMYLFSAHKKGISSCQFAKDVGVSQPSAWFMLGRLRFASKNLFKNQFEGIAEIDEAYLGGSETNKHAKKEKAKGEKPKTVVIGMINRETKQVKAIKVSTAEKDVLLPKIALGVKKGSCIVTDTYHAYKDLKKNYTHKTVKHSAGEYVKIEARTAFKIHTNTIEGFWSLLKKGLNGTYYWASKKHINGYLAEYSLRYNNRALLDSTKFQNFFNNIQGKLSYKQLIA